MCYLTSFAVFVYPPDESFKWESALVRGVVDYPCHYTDVSKFILSFVL